MAILKRLEKFLNNNGVSYGSFTHHRATTAVAAALAEHVPPAEHAKVVIVKPDDCRGVMVVLPANRRLSEEKLKERLKAKTIRIALEEEICDLFDDCELGAMPPFGNLYGLPVWVDEALTHDPVIVFNAGTHKDSVQMSYADFARLVKPRVADLS